MHVAPNKAECSSMSYWTTLKALIFDMLLYIKQLQESLAILEQNASYEQLVPATGEK